MLDSPPFSLESLPFPDSSSAEREHQWRVWAAREIQQRALLAYHILDGLVAQMSGDGASARHVANPLNLPTAKLHSMLARPTSGLYTCGPRRHSSLHSD